jgi:isoquinoline 1-oxidoreductase beta subunit
MQHDHYRPAALVKLEGALDGAGKATALRVRVVAQPISGGRGGRIDGPAVAGIADTPYVVPAFHVDYMRPDLPVPVGYWRSVGPSQNAFMLESFLDEMAHAAGRDPVELRLELLAAEPRMQQVVRLAAQRSGWGTPPPAGRARGIAFVHDTSSFVAEVAEVSLEAGAIRVHRVTAVIDCGQVIHAGIVRGQVEGAIIGGLAAALHGEITIRDGRVEQGNFDDYPLLRMSEAPSIDVHIVRSTEEPGGVGEPGLPPIAPAVGNALFALTGRRVRSLPIRPESLASE